MPEYITSQGDQIDWICWKHYGTPRNGTVEAVLEANKGLSAYGPKLPAGVKITLPELAKPAAEQEVIRLWD